MPSIRRQPEVWRPPATLWHPSRDAGHGSRHGRAWSGPRKDRSQNQTGSEEASELIQIQVLWVRMRRRRRRRTGYTKPFAAATARSPPPPTGCPSCWRAPSAPPPTAAIAPLRDGLRSVPLGQRRNCRVRCSAVDPESRARGISVPSLAGAGTHRARRAAAVGPSRWSGRDLHRGRTGRRTREHRRRPAT